MVIMNRKDSLLIILIVLLPLVFSQAQERDSVMSGDNRVCIGCHGNKYYTLHNDVIERHERKLMNPYFVIVTIAFLDGEHHDHSCTDCHLTGYKKYPHLANLKLEPQSRCLDCHDFEAIEEELQNSIHIKAFGEHFYCEMCHDPHSNKLVRSSYEENISYNNHRCLNCHNDIDKYQILTMHEKPQLMESHGWLPNQALHFAHVRCIECHTSFNDTIVETHRIVSKDNAVKNCAECHSTNSKLRDKLHRYIAQERRSEFGPYNSFITNEAYVIGANRNKKLNMLCLLFLGVTILGITIHIAMRIIKHRKNE